MFEAVPLAALLLPALQSPTAEPKASKPSHVLVFASSRTGEGDLYVLTGEDAPARLLTGSALPEGSPRWDPARRRVVFQRFPADGQAGPTMLMAFPSPESSGQASELFEDPGGEAAPSWSPGGKRMALVRPREQGEAIFLANERGGESRPLTRGRFIDRYPAWGPHGEWLVFARKLPTGWDLHTLDVTDSDAEPQRVTHGGRYVGHPSWSPDGAFIAFDTTFGGDTEIAILELATGETRRVAERKGNDLVPTWSPDGRRIVFGGVDPSSGNWDLWQVEVATGELQRLTEDPAFDGAPVFVPAEAVGL